MTQRCKTCDHPRRGEVDIEIARGLPATEIAKKHGLPRSSVMRHRRNGHVPPSVVAAFPQHAADLSAEALRKLRADESSAVLLHLAEQRSRLLRLQDEAERKRWRPLVLQAANAIHRNIELVARAVGEFAQHERAVTQVAHLHVMMQPEYVQLRAGLIRALRPYPAARAAVGAVLAELEGRPVHFDGIRAGVDGVVQTEARADG